MALPPKYQPSSDPPLVVGTPDDALVDTDTVIEINFDESILRREIVRLECILTSAFQCVGADAPSFIETLRNKPTDFLTDERPGIRRLAQLYQSMVPPPTPWYHKAVGKLARLRFQRT